MHNENSLQTKLGGGAQLRLRDGANDDPVVTVGEKKKMHNNPHHHACWHGLIA